MKISRRNVSDKFGTSPYIDEAVERLSIWWYSNMLHIFEYGECLHTHTNSTACIEKVIICVDIWLNTVVFHLLALLQCADEILRVGTFR
jgi:hypothetical protein